MTEREMLKSGGRSGERGAVAVIVAACLVMLVSVTAIAVDVGRLLYVRNNLQIALDSAMKAAGAAALSLPSGLTTQQIQAESQRIATNYMRANVRMSADLVAFNPSDTSNFSVTYIAANPSAPNTGNEDSVVGNVTAAVPMTFARIFRVNNVPLTLTSRVKRPRPSPVQMVIALDNTSSMNQAFGTTTKIAALKTSAKSLVTTLMRGDNVRIGLLPFSTYIRLDPNAGYFNHASLTSQVPWLTFAAQPVINDCIAWQRSNCRLVDGGTCYNDGVPYSCQYTLCDSLVCTDWRLRANSWGGCVWFRPPPLRTTIADPLTRPYFGIWSWSGCGYATIITDLVRKGTTYTASGRSYTAEQWLNGKIDALTVNTIGLTYIPAALIWSWNMLTNDGVTATPLNSGFTDAEVRQLGVRKALVLITDGNNSGFAYTGVANAYDALGTIQNVANSASQQAAYLAQTNADMVTICRNIRDANIDIYVIALQLTAADMSYRALLRDQCASNNGNGTFFDVNDPPALQAAFNRIGMAFSYNSLTQ